MDNNALVFCSGMLFAMAMYVCLQAKKVSNEAVKILREHQKN